MDKWGRKQLHSHSYRVPDPFHGEVVVVVGCHESGKDIALDDVTPGVPKAVSRHRNLHLRHQVSKAGTIQAVRLLLNLIWHVLDRSNTCARTGRWCSTMVPVSSPTPSSTAQDTTSHTHSWTPAGWSPWMTTEWARCSSTRSRRRCRRSSPSSACPRR
jgi:hypothetical protein